ncbi:MAG: hypothetical protein IJZ27_01745, partial [Treponema sp.]|nr:hypothetical protein [Treponema sp.]
MKRQTVTLPKREFYDKVKDLKPEIKNHVIGAILDLFFEEKPIEYENLPENVGLVLACIVPDLRRVQTQFNNGKVQKNSEQTSQGLFCPFEPSQLKPIEAKQSQ